MLAAASPRMGGKEPRVQHEIPPTCRGFRVVHVEWASRQSLDMTSINLIEIIANVCLPNLCTCLQG